MKKKNKTNIEIDDNNYSIYRNLLDEYINLKENPKSKYNLGKIVNRTSLIGVVLIALISLNVFSILNIPFELVALIAGVTFIDSIFKIITNEKRIKEQLDIMYPNLITDLDYLELSKKVHQHEYSKQIRRTRIRENPKKTNFSEINNQVLDEKQITRHQTKAKKLELKYKG